MPDLDYTRVTGRFAANALGPGPEAAPVWCDGGTVFIEPLVDSFKVVGAATPFTAGQAMIRCSIDRDGWLIDDDGNRYADVIDLTSSKVNPAVPASTATHRVRFFGVTAGGRPVMFPDLTCRLAGATADLARAAEVTPGSPVPVIVGERGPKGDKGDVGQTGATGAAGRGIVDTNASPLDGALVITYTDGSTSTVPVFGDTAVSGLVRNDASQTRSELTSRFAPIGPLPPNPDLSPIWVDTSRGMNLPPLIRYWNGQAWVSLQAVNILDSQNPTRNGDGTVTISPTGVYTATRTGNGVVTLAGGTTGNGGAVRNGDGTITLY